MYHGIRFWAQGFTNRLFTTRMSGGHSKVIEDLGRFFIVKSCLSHCACQHLPTECPYLPLVINNQNCSHKFPKYPRAWRGVERRGRGERALRARIHSSEGRGEDWEEGFICRIPLGDVKGDI